MNCTSNQVEVFIECLPLDSIKFEYNSRLGFSIPDSLEGRIRTIESPFTTYYGFTECYVSEDGDYLDSFILSTNCSFGRNEIVRAEIRKLILMRDNGVEDAKLICTYNNPVNKSDLDLIIDFLVEYSRDSITIDSVIDVKDIQSVKKLLDEYK